MKRNSGSERNRPKGLSRRQLLKTGALGAVAAVAGGPLPAIAGPKGKTRRPNFLLIITDQQGLDTITACGCPGIKTPHMDRLVRSGVWFSESHSADPLCSPARSSIFTGRMPSETGVIRNGLPIRPDMVNMGQWMGREGYETVYTGKWHLPHSFSLDVPGFTNIRTGLGGLGNLGDAAVSRTCEGYLRNRNGDRPFLLVASLLQPHDICQFVSMHTKAPDELPFPEIQGELPPLPPNFDYDPNEPAAIRTRPRPGWSERQWRYYIWSYYRHVEMVDAEIGRILQALDDAGLVDDTIVIFTADHGEGRGRHHMVLKNCLYDEAVKVPLVVSCPRRLPGGRRDSEHLVSGLDVMPTICDFAGVKPPARVLGRSLRPLLEDRRVEWREFTASEVVTIGRMIRTPGYKYITYRDDPVEQLFDMKNDPGETKNLAPDAAHATVLADHKKLLAQWESGLDPAKG